MRLPRTRWPEVACQPQAKRWVGTGHAPAEAAKSSRSAAANRSWRLDFPPGKHFLTKARSYPGDSLVSLSFRERGLLHIASFFGYFNPKSAGKPPS